MREVDLLVFFVPLIHREIDDPAELETVLGGEVQFLAHLVPRLTGELVELFRATRDEEAGIAHAEAQLGADGIRALRPDILGDGASAALLALAPEDIAEAWLALRLGKGVHAVAEGAGTALRCRDGPDLDLGVSRDHAGEDLEA